MERPKQHSSFLQAWKGPKYVEAQVVIPKAEVAQKEIDVCVCVCIVCKRKANRVVSQTAAFEEQFDRDRAR